MIKSACPLFFRKKGGFFLRNIHENLKKGSFRGHQVFICGHWVKFELYIIRIFGFKVRKVWLGQITKKNINLNSHWVDRQLKNRGDFLLNFRDIRKKGHFVA